MAHTLRSRGASRAIVLLIAAIAAGACTGSSSAIDRSARAGQLARAPQKDAYEGRQIIRTARIRLEVEHLESAGDRVAEVATGAGGYVENRSYADRRSVLTLRVPSEDLDPVLERLAGLGTERARSVSSQDVTEQVADTEASLQNARALRDRLRALLDRATQVEELLKIETELSRVQTQIDQTQGRLERLRSQVALSSISVTLERRRILGPVGYVLDRAAWALRKLFVLRD